MDLMHLFKQGGLVMYPLALLSFVALAIFFERMLYFRGIDTDMERLKRLLDYIADRDSNGVAEMAKEKPTDAVLLAQSYLSSKQEKQDKVQNLETQVNFKSMGYNDNLAFLSIIITLAPLLGTILGIISSFKVFDLQNGANQFAITSGVGEALIATAFGLIVAMFALVLYGVLKYQIGKLDKKLALCCVSLLDAK